MKDSDGNPIDAPAGFQLYRDGIPTGIPAIENRRDHFEDVFDTLGDAGIARDDLYLAWDFTVASTENMTGRMLSMRDQAFADLGDNDLTDGGTAIGPDDGDSPQFTINPNDGDPSSPSDSEEYDPNGDGPNGIVNFPDATTPTDHGGENIREVTGTVKVPCYMTDPDGDGGPLNACDPGAVLKLDANGDPEQNGFYDARFTCNIPRSAVRPGHRRRHCPGSDVDVRARAVRRLHRGAHPRRPHARQRPRRDDLRDRLHRHVRGRRRPGRDPGAARHVELQAAARPPPAGIPRLPLPGPGDDPSRRLRERSGVPVQRRSGHRHGQAAVLLRQQPGRDRRRRPDRRRDRLHPLGPLRAGDELLDPADPQHRLRGLRADPLPELPGRVRSPAAALADPVDVGSRRARRLRQPHDHRSAAEHARRTRC